MKHISATFIKSSAQLEQCPPDNRPEYAFIGRSNVGKSSLINMLTNNGNLAKVSNTPGKTQTINHFDINGEWYLADLPGYGYAQVGKTQRKDFTRMIRSYIEARPNLECLFVLVDGRHEPLVKDLEFLEWVGSKSIPFAMVFTKADKLKESELIANIEMYKASLLERWETLPELFITSSTSRQGRELLLDYIDTINESLVQTYQEKNKTVHRHFPLKAGSTMTSMEGRRTNKDDE